VNEEEWIRREALKRTNLHRGHDSQEILADDHDVAGMSGEVALGKFTGFMPDLTMRPKGDDGVDNKIILGFTVDVKAARKPYYLLHRVDHGFADIFILGHYSDETCETTLLKWTWGHVVKQAPVRRSSYGVLNHSIKAEDLKDIEELRSRLVKLG